MSSLLNAPNQIDTSPKNSYNNLITSVRFGGMLMKSLPQISEAEFEVMKILWRYAPMNTNQVIEQLRPITNWSPKTIQTLLKRLVTKGALTYEKQSRIFVYTPLVQEKEYIHEKSRVFLNRYYAGNISSMLSVYLEEDDLSPKDIESLRQLLFKKDPEGR